MRPKQSLKPTPDGTDARAEDFRGSAVEVHVTVQRRFNFLREALMRPLVYISTSLAVAVLASGCHSPNRAIEAPVAPVVSQAPAPKIFTSPTDHWPVPSDLPTFGIPSTNSIRVAVFGMYGAVTRPGYYYLAQGAVVRDAVEAAQGLGVMVGWRHYSGIERPKPDGSFEVVRFTQGRLADELIVLRDGDRLYFGHEVY